MRATRASRMVMRIADAMSPNPICCTAPCPAQIGANLMVQVEHGLVLCWKEVGTASFVFLRTAICALRCLADGETAQARWWATA